MIADNFFYRRRISQERLIQHLRLALFGDQFLKMREDQDAPGHAGCAVRARR